MPKAKAAKAPRTKESQASALKKQPNQATFGKSIVLDERMTRRFSHLGEPANAVMNWSGLPRLWAALVHQHRASAPRKLHQIVSLLVQAELIDTAEMKTRAAQQQEDAERLRQAAKVLERYAPQLNTVANTFDVDRRSAQSWHASSGAPFDTWKMSKDPPDTVDLLYETAKQIESAVSAYVTMRVDASNVGQRGGVPVNSRPEESRKRALLIRELDGLLPESFTKRYAVIAELLSCAGIAVNRHLVRSTILKGRT